MVYIYIYVLYSSLESKSALVFASMFSRHYTYSFTVYLTVDDVGSHRGTTSMYV